MSKPIQADSRLAQSQWETSLQSNAVSHWLGANLESTLLHQEGSLAWKQWGPKGVFSAHLPTGNTETSPNMIAQGREKAGIEGEALKTCFQGPVYLSKIHVSQQVHIFPNMDSDLPVEIHVNTIHVNYHSFFENLL